jgi:phosphohistidine phosphatase
VKTLHLLRHAKSDWADSELSDEERPLNGRGKRDAKALARHLEAHPMAVQMALCSPALRARRTLEAISPALPGAVIEKEPKIYAAGAEQLLKLVRRCPRRLGSLLLVGHNPGFEDLTRMLLAAKEAPATFPTCTLATLTFDTDDWAAIEPGAGRLAGFLTPADFNP